MTRATTIHITTIGSVFAALLPAAGCADQQSTQSLSAGYAALDARNYDAVTADANAVLDHSPTGPVAAEALYLKGRALEQRSKASDADTQVDYAAAIRCYNEALQSEPTRTVQAHIRCDCANILYWQRDFAGAAAQWSRAYDLLDDTDTDTRSMALYRIGLCRQRMGNFVQADADFARVQHLYPDSEAARRAHEHQGARVFWLQLATFANNQSADTAIRTLRSRGVAATAAADPRGRSVVSVGPFPTYAAAWTMHDQFAAQYPDSIVLP